MTNFNKLRWQCRRGNLELDIILLRYLEQQYAQAPIAEQNQFTQILNYEDQLLYQYLIAGKDSSDHEFNDLIQKIRQLHPL